MARPAVKIPGSTWIIIELVQSVAVVAKNANERDLLS
jgi:hypothetical protein